MHERFIVQLPNHPASNSPVLNHKILKKQSSLEPAWAILIALIRHTIQCRVPAIPLKYTFNSVCVYKGILVLIRLHKTVYPQESPKLATQKKKVRPSKKLIKFDLRRNGCNRPIVLSDRLILWSGRKHTNSQQLRNVLKLNNFKNSKAHLGCLNEFIACANKFASIDSYMAIAFEANVIVKLFILAIVFGKTLLSLLIYSYY